MPACAPNATAGPFLSIHTVWKYTTQKPPSTLADRIQADASAAWCGNTSRMYDETAVVVPSVPKQSMPHPNATPIQES